VLLLFLTDVFTSLLQEKSNNMAIKKTPGFIIIKYSVMPCN